MFGLEIHLVYILFESQFSLLRILDPELWNSYRKGVVLFLDHLVCLFFNLPSRLANTIYSLCQLTPWPSAENDTSNANSGDSLWCGYLSTKAPDLTHQFTSYRVQNSHWATMTFSLYYLELKVSQWPLHEWHYCLSEPSEQTHLKYYFKTDEDTP